MQSYRVLLQGDRLLMDRMPDETLEDLRTGKRSPKDRSQSKEDECRPKIYRDANGNIVVPVINLLAALVHAGRQVKIGKVQVSTAKTTNLFGFMTVSGENMPLLVFDGTQWRQATDEDWEPDTRRGTNPNGGEAVSVVRPKFTNWAVTATVTFDPSQKVKLDNIETIFETAGRVSGLCSFRPQKRGNFGMFTPVEWRKLDKAVGVIDEETQDAMRTATLAYLDKLELEEDAA